MNTFVDTDGGLRLEVEDVPGRVYLSSVAGAFSLPIWMLALTPENATNLAKVLAVAARAAKRST